MANFSFGADRYCTGRIFEIDPVSLPWENYPRIYTEIHRICEKCNFVTKLPQLPQNGRLRCIGIFNGDIKVATKVEIGVALFGDRECNCPPVKPICNSLVTTMAPSQKCGSWYGGTLSCTKIGVYRCPFCTKVVCDEEHMALHLRESKRCQRAESLTVEIAAIGAELDPYYGVINKPAVPEPGCEPLVGDVKAIVRQLKRRLIRPAIRGYLDMKEMVPNVPRYALVQSAEFLTLYHSGRFICKWLPHCVSDEGTSCIGAMRSVIPFPPLINLPTYQGLYEFLFESFNEFELEEHAIAIAPLLAIDTSPQFFQINSHKALDVFTARSYTRLVVNHFNPERQKKHPGPYASVLAAHGEAYILEQNNNIMDALFTCTPLAGVLYQIIVGYCGYDDPTTSLGQFLVMYRHVQRDIAMHGDKILAYIESLGWRRA